MVDLTHVKWLPNRFGGSESKWTMQYNDKLYMVKFPDPNRALKQTSQPYINNHFSEYIGCHIFQMLGIPAQNTFLRRATPPNSEKEKLVVACEVFSPSSEGGARRKKRVQLLKLQSFQSTRPRGARLCLFTGA